MKRNIEVYAIIKDEIIKAVYHTADGMDGVNASIKNSGIEYDEIIKVPIGFTGGKKQNIKEFDSEFNMHPLSKRVADGYVKIPEGHKLKDEKIVPMNKQEKVEAGLETIDRNLKAVGDDIVPKTEEELVSEGIMTQKEIDDEKLVREEERLIQEQIQKDMRASAIAKLGNKLKQVKA